MNQLELGFTEQNDVDIQVFKCHIDLKFSEYDNSNPEVWKMFKKYALQAIEAKRLHFSSDAILHRIRWFHDIEIRSNDSFKINNNFSSRYARKFDNEYPQYNYLFEKRSIK